MKNKGNMIENVDFGSIFAVVILISMAAFGVYLLSSATFGNRCANYFEEYTPDWQECVYLLEEGKKLDLTEDDEGNIILEGARNE